MRITATPTIRPHPIHAHQARFAWWLAVAVFLHALLLLIPARQDPLPGPALTALTVALSRAWRPPQQASPTERGHDELAATEKRQAPQSRTSAEPPPAVAPRVESPSPPPAAVAMPGESRSPITTARLLDFAHRREWNLPEPTAPSRPGEFTPRSSSSNWRSDAPAESAPAGKAALPSKTEIVDQWLASDGSRNVMLRAPNGLVLCGRAEAWNPMIPLVEPVMMYRACGDGRRTFEMPPRPVDVLLR